MNVIEATFTNVKCPWPGGAVVSILASDITAVGRLDVHGDSVTRCMVAIDKTIFFVKISAQSKENQKWLQSHFKTIPARWADRDQRWIEQWKAVV